MPRLFAVVVATLALSACASSGTQAPAPAPAPATGASSASAAAPKSAGAAPAAMTASSAKPAPFSPVGNYEFATEVNGAPMKGNISIGGSVGAYNGKMTSDIMPELPITSVSVEGQVVKMLADTPNGTVTITLTFTGDTFAGNWELGGQGGNLTGKRITK